VPNRLVTEARRDVIRAQDLASHPTAANEATLSSAISSLKALGAPLLAELKTSCPGS
jgi:hypothetical protein